MTDSELLWEILLSEQNVVAMVAPSFPIIFNPETIGGQLRQAGFAEVVEVASGARQTNEMLIKKLANNKTLRLITSPCPNIVRMIKTRFPEAAKYLSSDVDSPMIATAKKVRTTFPGKKPVFIGPCLVKRLEAAEEHPELEILCVTFKDIQQIFEKLHITEESVGKDIPFGLSDAKTRLYPISGGLTQSSEIRALLSDDEIEVVSGAKNDEEAIQRFINSDRIRLLDILFCDGGCINGPGIASQLNLEARRKKVTDYWNKPR